MQFDERVGTQPGQPDKSWPHLGSWEDLDAAECHSVSEHGYRAPTDTHKSMSIE